MQYPLTEKIGEPELLVGREKEFNHFGKWIKNIPKRLSKSRVIIARRKSGKTTFVQRIFNQKYASFYDEPITNYTAMQINKLCMADPFFISCVITSIYEEKDLTTSTGVANTVDYELSVDTAEMYLTWGEYIDKTVNEVNDQNAKNILLFLSQNNKEYFTPNDLKEKLGLNLEVNEIHKQLIVLKEADLINRGVSNIKFKGLEDGTLNLILRKSFAEEIEGFEPDFKQEFADQIAELQKQKLK